MEAEREEIIARVSELESQLSMHLSGNQKEKVAENVEYIRVWRQMKQQQEKLNSMSGLNESLKAQIKDLKNLLDQTSKYVILFYLIFIFFFLFINFLFAEVKVK